MGQSCGCEDSDHINKQVIPNTTSQSFKRVSWRPNLVEVGESADSDYAQFTGHQPYLPQPSLVERDSLQHTNDPTYGTQQTDSIIEGFKHAIEMGNDSLIMHYIQDEEYEMIDFLDIKFKNGDNCLHTAVQHKQYNLIMYFLSQGVEPNEPNSNADTPLHAAVRVNDLKIATILLKYDAVPSMKNKDGQSALDIAESKKLDDIIELLAPRTQKLIVQVQNLDKFDTARINTARLQALAEDVLSDSADSPDDVPTMDLLGSKSNGQGTMHNTKRLTSAIEAVLSDEEDEIKLREEMRVVRNLEVKRIKNSNPFSQLKRKTTRRVLHDVELWSSKRENLPVLEGWLEKKSTTFGQGWQARWVVVKYSHMLWSHREMKIDNAKNRKERAKWSKDIHLMTITDVKVVKDQKMKRKFAVNVTTYGKKDKSREYLWRAKDEQDRDKWVDGLKQHIQVMKKMVLYMGEDDIDD